MTINRKQQLIQKAMTRRTDKRRRKSKSPELIGKYISSDDEPEEESGGESDEESEENGSDSSYEVIRKKPRRRKVRVITSDSEDSDKDRDSDYIPTKSSRESSIEKTCLQSEDDGIEFLGEFPFGTTNRSVYKFNEFSDSDTYSSGHSDGGLDDISDTEIEVSVTDKAVEPTPQSIDTFVEQIKDLVSVTSKSVSNDSDKNSLETELPIQSIESITCPQSKEPTELTDIQSVRSMSISSDIMSIESGEMFSDSESPEIIAESDPKTTEDPKTVEKCDQKPVKEVSIESKSVPIVEPSEPPPMPRQLPKAPEPPQPQLPSLPHNPIMLVETPKLQPFDTTTWKNGTAVRIPAPPRLPSHLRFQLIGPQLTKNQIKLRLNNNSDEIEAIDQTLKISLICPISNKRVVTPSRSVQCHHFDCFDIENFLNIVFNKKVEDWKCPKCRVPATIRDLIIDSLLLHILNHNSVKDDPSVEAVVFDNQGIWVPDIKLPEIQSNQNSDSNVINIFDATVEDIIDLEDDDDDEPTPNSQLKVPNTSIIESIERQSASLNQTLPTHNTTVPTNRNSEGANRWGEQELAERDRRQRTSRWSDSPNPQSSAANNPSMPTFRQTFTAVPQSSHQSSAQTSRPTARPVSVRVSAVTTNHSNASTNSTQNLSDKDFNLKFTWTNNVLTVSCPSCNESFGEELQEQHINSAAHKEKVRLRRMQASNTQRPPPIRSTHNTNPSYRNPVQPVVNNINRNPRPVNANRAPVRTYGAYNMAANNYPNNWAQYGGQQQQQQTPVYATNYQYAYPPLPSITNNFYSPTPTYVQQIAPPAHQSTNMPAPAPAHQNMYANPLNNNQYTYSNQNPSNGYYNQF